MGKARKRTGGNVKPASPAQKSSEKNHANGEVKNQENSDGNDPSTPVTWGSTLKNFASDFPLISATLTVGIPYGLYLLYFVILLQHPHRVPLLRLRPGILDTTPRQVLIVGTMGAGTTQVSHELKEKLGGLEIEHEVADASWHFARDGTVSWFHGIRFFDSEIKVLELCDQAVVKNMGFHPRMYTANTTCSHREVWSNCWERECLRRVLKEWNCARRQKCETPFQYNLWQLRNPMRTIESLVTKFCQGSSLDTGVIHPTFTHLTKALFPQLASDIEGASCIEAVATYVVEYSRVMLIALEEGILDAAYAVETASPCQVAKLAGLLDETTTVYAPNFRKVQAYCGTETTDPALPQPKDKPFVKEKNRRNVGIVSFGWADLRGGVHNSSRPVGDTRIEDMVKELYRDLSAYYDVEEESSGEDAEFA